MYTERHDYRYGSRVPWEKRKTKMAIFKILPCDWQPVECLEQWSNVFMSVLAENSLRCVVLNFLQPVQLITVDVNEQRVAAVQPTENKGHISWAVAFVVRRWRVELILLISKYTERLMWSICLAIDRVASVQTPRFFIWPLRAISCLSTIKYFSCDTVTVLRDDGFTRFNQNSFRSPVESSI